LQSLTELTPAASAAEAVGAAGGEDMALGRTAAAAAATTMPDHGPRGVAAEVVDATQFAALRPAWLELAAHIAEPNAFMDPALVAAAAATNPDVAFRVLLAWQSRDGGAARQMVGAWAFALDRPRKSPLPLRMLVAPVHVHGHLATPVLDRECPEAALQAMLDAVADDAQCPKIIALEAMGTDGPAMAALARVLEGRGSAPCVFERAQRPKLGAGLDGETYLKAAFSSSSRKKLRQHRRRLAEQGAFARVIATEPAALARAVEDFLALEASGWKGRQGTAFLCNEGHAAFLRAAVAGLAEHGGVTIDALTIESRAVSTQIILRCGTAAFTWKTAFDEKFQDYSPGMLLLEDYTTSFLADPGIAYVDSCAHDDKGFMAVWRERRAVADLWFDARRGGSLAFRTLSTLQRTYRDLRASAKAAYLAARTRKR
jgi:CelD/BcsL family acetyltransferase involved in cellulose biosynthesis